MDFLEQLEKVKEFQDEAKREPIVNLFFNDSEDDFKRVKFTKRLSAFIVEEMIAILKSKKNLFNDYVNFLLSKSKNKSDEDILKIAEKYPNEIYTVQDLTEWIDDKNKFIDKGEINEDEYVFPTKFAFLLIDV